MYGSIQDWASLEVSTRTISKALSTLGMNMYQTHGRLAATHSALLTLMEQQHQLIEADNITSDSYITSLITQLESFAQQMGDVLFWIRTTSLYRFSFNPYSIENFNIRVAGDLLRNTGATQSFLSTFLGTIYSQKYTYS